MTRSSLACMLAQRGVPIHGGVFFFYAWVWRAVGYSRVGETTLRLCIVSFSYGLSERVDSREYSNTTSMRNEPLREKLFNRSVAQKLRGLSLTSRHTHARTTMHVRWCDIRTTATLTPMNFSTTLPHNPACHVTFCVGGRALFWYLPHSSCRRRVRGRSAARE